MADINTTVEDNSSDDIVSKALNDDVQGGSNEGMDFFLDFSLNWNFLYEFW